jgi:hypothetical protein
MAQQLRILEPLQEHASVAISNIQDMHHKLGPAKRKQNHGTANRTTDHLQVKTTANGNLEPLRKSVGITAPNGMP